MILQRNIKKKGTVIRHRKKKTKNKKLANFIFWMVRISNEYKIYDNYGPFG